MSKRVFFIGGGAVGAYTGGHMARAGIDVTLVDPWLEHVEKMRNEGLELRGVTEEESCSVKVNAMTPDEFKAIASTRPVDVGFICMKSYDTEWAAELIKPALAENGFVVSLQNCINEDRIAAIIGPQRTAGCIASTISVELTGPAMVQRTVPKRGDSYTVFRCGEYSGAASDRIEEVVGWLKNVDSAKMTTNLMGERWSKLTINSSHNGLSACTGYGSKDMALVETARRLSIRLSAETIKVAKALGITLETIKGFEPDEWIAAADGDAATLERIESATIEGAKKRASDGRPVDGSGHRQGPAHGN